MTRLQIICYTLALAMGLGMLPLVAFGHDWYDPACCDGKDCQPVNPDRVTATATGWRVQISPGDHVLSFKPIDVIVPYGDKKIRDSLDGEFHVCIGPHTNNIYCVYIPPMAS